MKELSFALVAVAVVSGCSDGSHPGSSYAEVTNATHDCAKGANASIATSDATFKLTSTCERILVKGENNKLTIEAAKRIDVDGAKNIIEVGAADMIRITGAGNTIRYRKKGITKQSPAVEAIGDNNSLIQSD
jgi:DUF3060 family protein